MENNNTNELMSEIECLTKVGIKISRGIQRFGGDVESYVKILRIFTKNTRKVLASIETINEEDILNYETTVHSIKGSCFTICANFVGNLARDLEKAAHEKDWNYIVEHHPPFLEAAWKLIDDLEKFFMTLDAKESEQAIDTSDAKPTKVRTQKKIMMVDDDQTILTMGRQILKDKYEVYPLPSAAKLFETLEKVHPDIILLDIRMPEIDGLEALKRLKADERYAKIPIIFVTSVDDDRSVYEHMNVGAYSTVSKPFSAPELLTRIENCLNDFFPADVYKTENEMPVILAIDDAPDILKMVSLILQDIYKVYTLSEPGKLKDLLGSITPNLFLLDYRMPEISGFDLIPVIRGFPQHKNTPIIFLTSEKTTDCFTEALRLGACDFVLKPIKVEVLREKVAKHIIHLK